MNTVTSAGDNERTRMILQETSLTVVTNQINLLETEECDTVSQPTSTKAVVAPITVVCGHIRHESKQSLLCHHESTLEFEV